MRFRLKVLFISFIRFVDKQCSSNVHSKEGGKYDNSKLRKYTKHERFRRVVSILFDMNSKLGVNLSDHIVKTTLNLLIIRGLDICLISLNKKNTVNK